MLWQGGGDGTVTEQIARMERLQAGPEGGGGGEVQSGSSENDGKKTNGNSQKQNQPGVPDYAIREQTGKHRPYKDKNGIHWADMNWKVTLYHKNKQTVGRGIQVGEEVVFDEKQRLGFTAKGYWKGG